MFLKTLETVVPYDPAALFPDIYLKDLHPTTDTFAYLWLWLHYSQQQANKLCFEKQVLFKENLRKLYMLPTVTCHLPAINILHTTFA